MIYLFGFTLIFGTLLKISHSSNITAGRERQGLNLDFDTQYIMILQYTYILLLKMDQTL